MPQNEEVPKPIALLVLILSIVVTWIIIGAAGYLVYEFVLGDL